MYKELDDQFLTIQASIDAIKKYTDALNHTLNKHDNNFKNIDYDFYKIKTLLKYLMVRNQNFSLFKMDSPKYQDTVAVVPDNKKNPPL